MILLGGMVAEWIFSVGSNWQLWRRSAWHIGLGLAAISYSLLLTEAVNPSDGSVWSLIGLTIPVTEKLGKSPVLQNGLNFIVL